MNRLVRLELGTVQLPDTHPRAADGHCPILCFAVVHPDGVVVVDTGPRAGHPVIDELYAPQVVSIVEALHQAGIDEREVGDIVNTHLHFDHCGQNDRLPQANVWVTAEEVEAAAQPMYTVPQWAAIDADRLRLSRDDTEVADGVRLLHTPGHTPGHQSVAVQTTLGLEIVAGQTCYSCAEFDSDAPMVADMHDDSWLVAGTESLRRLQALTADVCHFSHDRSTWQPSAR